MHKKEVHSVRHKCNVIALEANTITEIECFVAK